MACRIGSAASGTLVLQTVLPVLVWAASGTNPERRAMFESGRHHGMSPPIHFIERTFLSQLRRAGVGAEIKLTRFGFYPAGGGTFIARHAGDDARTNAAVIQQFLTVNIAGEAGDAHSQNRAARFRFSI